MCVLNKSEILFMENIAYHEVINCYIIEYEVLDGSKVLQLFNFLFENLINIFEYILSSITMRIVLMRI